MAHSSLKKRACVSSSVPRGGLRDRLGAVIRANLEPRHDPLEERGDGVSDGRDEGSCGRNDHRRQPLLEWFLCEPPERLPDLTVLEPRDLCRRKLDSRKPETESRTQVGRLSDMTSEDRPDLVVRSGKRLVVGNLRCHVVPQREVPPVLRVRLNEC